MCVEQNPSRVDVFPKAAFRAIVAQPFPSPWTPLSPPVPIRCLPSPPRGELGPCRRDGVMDGWSSSAARDRAPAPAPQPPPAGSASGRLDGCCAGIFAQEISLAREGSCILLPALLSGSVHPFPASRGRTVILGLLVPVCSGLTASLLRTGVPAGRDKQR